MLVHLQDSPADGFFQFPNTSCAWQTLINYYWHQDILVWAWGWLLSFFHMYWQQSLSCTRWPVVGNEAMESYMVMMGMKLPSFPTFRACQFTQNILKTFSPAHDGPKPTFHSDSSSMDLLKTFVPFLSNTKLTSNDTPQKFNIPRMMGLGRSTVSLASK